MKKHFLLIIMLSLILVMGGCKEKKKEFVAGDKELIHLTSTPRGGVESYQIYTTNIMIYVDGTVKIYASDFVRWFGRDEIPELEVTLGKDDVEAIKQLIIDQDLYNLREDVGNKDGISGVVKQMTIYAADGTNTTGGISVSNRQFVRAYDRIEAMVREELFIYTAEINDIQYEGYLLFDNRSVEITDREGNTIINHEDINSVYSYTEELEDENAYYTVIEFNDNGGDVLEDVTFWATKENVVVLYLHLSGSFETNIAITESLVDNKLYIPQQSEEAANALVDRINENIK